jgi:copper chaperone CopZ
MTSLAPTKTRLLCVWLLLAASAGAEFRELRFTVEDTGCASCAESLVRRLGRVRGVESVRVAAPGTYVIALTAGNTARPDLLRDFVEQGGNRIQRVLAVADGEITEDAGERWFRPSGLASRYRLDGAPDSAAATAGRLTAESNARLERWTTIEWKTADAGARD